MSQSIQFHLPTKPYNVIDAINRHAVATGSPAYAMAAGAADYNGHYLTLAWNDYRGYYVGEYHWGERVVFVRSSDFAVALEAAKQEYARQGRGASLQVYPRFVDMHVARQYPDLIEGIEDLDATNWYTWKHKEVSSARRLHTEHLLIAATDQDNYQRQLQSFLSGRRAGVPTPD